MLSDRSTGFIRHFLTAYPRRTAATVFLLILAGLAEGVGVITLLPMLEQAVDGSAAQGSRLARLVVWVTESLGIAPTLGGLLLVIVLAITAKGLLRWFAMQQVGYTIARVATELRLRLLRAVVRARWQYFVDQAGGTYANAISYEARRAAWAYKRACSGFADAIQAVVYLAIAFAISWPVALLAPLVGAILLYVLRGFVAASREAGLRQTEAMEALVGRLTELLPNIKPVKAMSREKDLVGLIEEEVWAYNEAERHSVHAYEAVDALREPIITIALALGLYGALSLGNLPFSVVITLAFVFYRLMIAVGHLQQKYQLMAHGESAFWSLVRKIDQAERAEEARQTTGTTPQLSEHIQLHDVTLAYEETVILRDVSICIPAGRFVALSGPSGAGKTTLIDAVTGLLRPVSGFLEIDGTSLQDADLDAWRQQIGYVPQELLLLHDTVYRNVTLGDPSIRRDQVIQALKAAGAWSFVAHHPEGLDRIIGEQGGRLSGGQGQRLMIARALVHEPRLLILDEATTGVDPETERQLYDTLHGLLGSLTIIAISHQAALDGYADLIFEVTDHQVRRIQPPVVTS
jgi:ATP-binding cassette subfamily C protein